MTGIVPPATDAEGSGGKVPVPTSHERRGGPRALRRWAVGLVLVAVLAGATVVLGRATDPARGGTGGGSICAPRAPGQSMTMNLGGFDLQGPAGMHLRRVEPFGASGIELRDVALVRESGIGSAAGDLTDLFGSDPALVFRVGDRVPAHTQHVSVMATVARTGDGPGRLEAVRVTYTSAGMPHRLTSGFAVDLVEGRCAQ